MNFLVIEDNPTTTADAVANLEKLGHTVIVVATVEEARESLNKTHFRGVVLDQLLPMRPGGPLAEDDEVLELARDIGEGSFEANSSGIYFIWVTAHEVEEQRSTMPGCLGTVRKGGETGTAVSRYFGPAIEGYYDDMPADAIRDQVLMEVWRDSGDALMVNVPTWRPDENFIVSKENLPSWMLIALRTAEGGPIRIKARANLRAERPAQLDLGDFKLLPESEIDEKELWDA